MASVPGKTASLLPGSMARWWQDWKRGRVHLFDPENCRDDLKSIARCLNISVAELCWIASYSPCRAEFLRERMDALHLEPQEFARREPAKFCELVTLCTTCESQERCALDLADEFVDPGWQNWRNYCPNATTLSVLSTLQLCSCEPTESEASGA